MFDWSDFNNGCLLMFASYLDKNDFVTVPLITLLLIHSPSSSTLESMSSLEQENVATGDHFLLITT